MSFSRLIAHVASAIVVFVALAPAAAADPVQLPVVYTFAFQSSGVTDESGTPVIPHPSFEFSFTLPDFVTETGPFELSAHPAAGPVRLFRPRGDLVRDRAAAADPRQRYSAGGARAGAVHAPVGRRWCGSGCRADQEAGSSVEILGRRALWGVVRPAERLDVQSLVKEATLVVRQNGTESLAFHVQPCR